MQPQLSGATVALSILAGVFAILLPPLVAIAVHRRLRVGWRYFGYGLLTFLVFQVLTRIPAISLVQPAITPRLQAQPGLLWGWLFVLALSAGVFEEVGRYLAFRILLGREAKTWSKAAMLGVGHGAIESMLLVGVSGLVLLAQLVSFSHGGLATLPAAQHAALAHQLAASAALPAWAALLPAWERLCALTIQVALSVVVLQVFRRRRLAWLWLAIAAHTVIDAASVFLPQALGSGTLHAALATEAVLTGFALLALWTIAALRDRPAPGHSAASGEPSTRAPRPVGA